TDDERFSGADPLGDFDWLRNAAERQAHIHQPADETVSVSQLRDEVEQLQHQSRRATERAESLQSAWDTNVGPAPSVEGKGSYKDYLEAQRRYAQAQDMIEQASDPSRHNELLGFLKEEDQKKARRQHPRPKPQRTSDLGATTYLQQQRIQQHQPGRHALERYLVPQQAVKITDCGNKKDRDPR